MFSVGANQDSFVFVVLCLHSTLGALMWSCMALCVFAIRPLKACCLFRGDDVLCVCVYDMHVRVHVCVSFYVFSSFVLLGGCFCLLMRLVAID